MNDPCIYCGQTYGNHAAARSKCPVSGAVPGTWHPTNTFTPPNKVTAGVLAPIPLIQWPCPMPASANDPIWNVHCAKCGIRWGSHQGTKAYCGGNAVNQNDQFEPHPVYILPQKAEEASGKTAVFVKYERACVCPIKTLTSTGHESGCEHKR